ncbi:ABC transporter substrate-binding protein [Streptomyces pathocidini]|uniref:ABC transporter substrate-binding protein n=1 Tax=Streptomyces pathocidini TaxID=1650571 RepID=A0ABW7UQV6_9ACTN|nr:ABC transporter substrate-binding protein [Streptomyces pathocidini]
MDPQRDWQFLDDRGRLAAAPRQPSRIVAYIQAGATLWDHGIAPVGLFGSGHDGERPDPVKAGALPVEDIAYLGSGPELTADSLLGAGPDLVVAVTYGGGQVYGIDPEVAKHLEESVPVVVLDVGQGRELGDVRDRFTALADALGDGGGGTPPAAEEFDAAAARLRTAAAGPARPRVLALSPAGPDAHLARPRAWAGLRALAEHGVNVVDPAEGPGANWSTVPCAEVAALAPDIILADARANATPLQDLHTDDHWRTLLDGARAVVPWNPEAPCSHAAHARFFDSIAAALRGAG